MFFLLSGLLAKKYLIKVGDGAGDKGDGVDQGAGDYSSSLNIEMTEYGQFNIMIGFNFSILILKKYQRFKEETEGEVEGEEGEP